MPRQALYVVAYDISEDRERARVDKILIGFGFRVQKSVFECRLSKPARQRLESRLAKLEISSGHVLIYRIATAQRSAAIGAAPPPPDAEVAFIL